MKMSGKNSRTKVQKTILEKSWKEVDKRRSRKKFVTKRGKSEEKKVRKKIRDKNLENSPEKSREKFDIKVGKMEKNQKKKSRERLREYWRRKS